MAASHPTFGNGKICYLEIPAQDVQVSAGFYETVFGWALRKNNETEISFDDGVGEVSGMWVTGRPPQTTGITISIMVTDIYATVEKIKANGGKVVNDIVEMGSDKVAHFSDPAGNFLGLYEHRE